jgi:hypothetical protein
MAFEVGDLKDVLLSEIFIDTYSSKVGHDCDILVLSFSIFDKQAAIDLVDFIEKGYEFVLDADISSSEISANKYLVFVELLRRYAAIEQIFTILSDLEAASGINKDGWKFQYINNENFHPLTKENIKKYVPLSAKSYKINIENENEKETTIEEIKTLSGLPLNEKFKMDNEIATYMNNAGLNPYNIK